ncbi:hypothetical protein [Parasitella parasitica]|uniref:Uncharacterized protein n=1 Tax=Parasitella parasitica TaxID=35722 RepID=A0A0B7NA87_9FUNG|nr:hypothetical protein [Parasitella parasitica]
MRIYKALSGAKRLASIQNSSRSRTLNRHARTENRRDIHLYQAGFQTYFAPASSSALGPGIEFSSRGASTVSTSLSRFAGLNSHRFVLRITISQVDGDFDSEDLATLTVEEGVMKS